MTGPKRQRESNSAAIEGGMVSFLWWMVWGGIVAAFLVPLVVDDELVYPFSSTKSFWFMGAVEFSLAAWVCLVAWKREFRPTANVVTIALLAFLALATISAVFGPDPNRHFWSTFERLSGLVMYVHLFAFFLILSSFPGSEAEWRRLFSLSVLVASVVSVCGLSLNFGFDSVSRAMESLRIVPAGIGPIAKSGSTLGNTSFLGTYLQINAFFSIWLLWTGKKGWRRWLVAAALVSIASGIMLNPGGRAMKASFLFGLVLLPVMWLLLNGKRPKLRKGAVIALIASGPATILIGAAMFLWWGPGFEALMEIRGMEERIVNWKIAASGFLERPFLGWGFEGYELLFTKYFEPSLLVSPGRLMQQPWFDRVHNVVLDHLVTVGLPGSIAILFAAGSSLFLIWRGGGNGKGDIRSGIVFTAMLLAHFVQGLSVFDTISSQMLLFAFYAYAAGKSRYANDSRTADAAPPSRWTKVLLPLCAAVLLPFAYWHCVHIPRRVAGAVSVIMMEDGEQASLDKYRMASGGSPVGLNEVRVLLAATAMKRLGEIEDFERDSHRFDEADFVIGELEKSALQCPEDIRVLHRLGELNLAAALLMSANERADGHEELALEYTDAAERAFRKILLLSPNHVLSHWGLARSLLYKAFLLEDVDLYQPALDAAERAIEIEPGIFLSHDLVVEIAVNLFEDRELALEKVERSTAINPRWERWLMKRVRSGL